MKDRGGTRALMKVCRRSRGSDILFCVEGEMRISGYSIRSYNC